MRANPLFRDLTISESLWLHNYHGVFRSHKNSLYVYILHIHPLDEACEEFLLVGSVTFNSLMNKKNKLKQRAGITQYQAP